MDTPMWMVRAGAGGYLFNDFIEKGCVAIGWNEMGDVSGLHSPEEFKVRLRNLYPADSDGSIAASAATMFRFRQVLKAGDRVVSYSPDRRQYAVGTIDGDYEYQPGRVHDFNHVRPVCWENRHVSRDELSTPAKAALGSAWTLFDPGVDARRELEAALRPSRSAADAGQIAGEEVRDEDFGLVREDAAVKSHEFVKDRILKLSPDEMEHLAAALLRAMGYKTRVSRKGGDRGRDVVASPDGFGFVPPRIIVQVKHTKSKTPGEDIRAFVGALQTGDKALFVSTGGFSEHALGEAERSDPPVAVVDLDELARRVVEHYDSFDAEGRSLLPLVRIYWPVS